jgi:hypothetical protein
LRRALSWQRHRLLSLVAGWWQTPGRKLTVGRVVVRETKARGAIASNATGRRDVEHRLVETVRQMNGRRPIAGAMGRVGRLERLGVACTT